MKRPQHEKVGIRTDGLITPSPGQLSPYEIALNEIQSLKSQLKQREEDIKNIRNAWNETGRMCREKDNKIKELKEALREVIVIAEEAASGTVSIGDRTTNRYRNFIDKAKKLL